MDQHSTEPRPELEVPTRAAILEQVRQLTSEDLEVLADECDSLVAVRRKDAAAALVSPWLLDHAKDAITKALVAHRLVWEASGILELIGKEIDALLPQLVPVDSVDGRDEGLKDLMQATRWDDLHEVLMASAARATAITASMPNSDDEVSPDEMDRRYAPEGSALVRPEPSLAAQRGAMPDAS